MIGELPDPMDGLTPARPAKVFHAHLRVGAGSAFPGPACGQDLRHTRASSSALRLVDDPALVTCAKCRLSPAYEVRLLLE